MMTHTELTLKFRQVEDPASKALTTQVVSHYVLGRPYWADLSVAAVMRFLEQYPIHTVRGYGDVKPTKTAASMAADRHTAAAKTQAQLAEELGLSTQQISNLETGTRELQKQTALALEGLLQLSRLRDQGTSAVDAPVRNYENEFNDFLKESEGILVDEMDLKPTTEPLKQELEYCTVTEELNVLDIRVTEFISYGWAPLGGICVYVNYSSYSDTSPVALGIQAMTRPKPKQD